MYYQLFNDNEDYSLKNINSLETLNNKKNVKLIAISDCKLTFIPNLTDFINLETLNCCYNELSTLPNFPCNLKTLYCGNNKLTELLQLPNKLITLSCCNNNLIKLPKLSSNLIYLDCCNNNLIQLPDLPVNFKFLYCFNNQFIQLPKLLINFSYIQFYNNMQNIKTIINCKSLTYHKKYNNYMYLKKINYLLNDTIEKYYYFRLIQYYNNKYYI